MPHNFEDSVLVVLGIVGLMTLVYVVLSRFKSIPRTVKPLGPAEKALAPGFAGCLLVVSGLSALGLTTADPTSPSPLGVVALIVGIVAAAFSFSQSRSQALRWTWIFVIGNGLSALYTLAVFAEQYQRQREAVLVLVPVLLRGGFSALLGVWAAWNLQAKKDVSIAQSNICIIGVSITGAGVFSILVGSSQPRGYRSVLGLYLHQEFALSSMTDAEVFTYIGLFGLAIGVVFGLVAFVRGSERSQLKLRSEGTAPGVRELKLEPTVADPRRCITIFDLLRVALGLAAGIGVTLLAAKKIGGAWILLTFIASTGCSYALLGYAIASIVGVLRQRCSPQSHIGHEITCYVLSHSKGGKHRDDLQDHA